MGNKKINVKQEIKLDKIQEEPIIMENEEQDNTENKTYNELRKIAKEKNLTFAKNVSKDELVNIIKNSEEVNANAISLDNMPVSPIVLTNEKEEIPAGFIAVKTKPKKEGINFHNGRAYKIVGNGYGIWSDNGQSFEISSLK